MRSPRSTQPGVQCGDKFCPSIQSEPAIRHRPMAVGRTVKLHIRRGYRKRAKITDSDRRFGSDRPRVVTWHGARVREGASRVIETWANRPSRWSLGKNQRLLWLRWGLTHVVLPIPHQPVMPVRDGRLDPCWSLARAPGGR